MSTYTDLHNTLKETLNVDYHSRKTNQVAKFENGLNEYWGTFHGRLDANGSEISGSSLSDVTITNAVLKGNISWGEEGFPASRILQDIKDLSDSLYEPHVGDIVVLKDDVDNLDARVGGLEEATGGLTGDVRRLSSSLTSQIYQTSSYLDQRITDVNNERFSYDKFLSSEISTTNENLKLSVVNINEDIENANLRIDNVIRNYKAADKILSAKIDKHIEENDREFEKVYHTIQKDRHYDIYSVPTTSYPYQLKDFAVNRIEARASNGQMFYEGKQIGQIYTKADNTISAFETFDLRSAPILTQALESGKFYQIIGQQTPVENGYFIDIDPLETSFVIKRAGSKYMNVLAPVGSKIRSIGRVVSFSPDTEAGSKLEDVQSGNINIFTVSDSVISTFNIGNTYFSKELSTITYPNNSNKLVYGGKNRLLFKFNCTTGHACYINDVDGVKFGMILSADVTGKTPDHIEKFDVYVDGLKEKKVTLLSSNNFFTESEEGKRIAYDKDAYTLSAQDEIVYQYTFIPYDTQTEYYHLSVRVGEKNIHLSSASFDTLKVDLRDAHRQFDKRTVTLTANEFKTEWSWSELEEDVRITLTYDGLSLVKHWESDVLPDEGTITYKLVRDSEEIVDSKIKISKPISFIFDVEIDDPEKEINGSIDPNVWEDSASQIADIGITKTSDEAIKLYIPDVDKSGDLSALSREFLMTTKIYSANKDRIEFKFFDPKGKDDGKSDVVIFNDKTKQLFVPTNNYYTYKLSEIKPNCFLVVDLNHYDLSVDVEKLQKELEAEKVKRAEDDLFISSQVSVNTEHIDDLYKQIHGGLVYKDTLSLDVEIESPYQPNTLKGLFVNNFKAKYDPTATNYDEFLSVRLRNGFYYISKAADKAKKFLIDGLDVRNGDLIIIKENTEVRDLAPEKVNIVDIMDHDAVHEDLLSAISVALSTDYYNKVLDLSIALSNDIDRLSGELNETSSDLQRQIISNDNDIAGISSRVDELTSDLSGSINFLSSEISSNDHDIFSISNDLYLEPNVLGKPGLSGKVDFLLSVGQNSMEYFGNAPILPWEEQQVNLALSDFLANFYKKENGDPDYDHFFKKGFAYRLSATQVLTPPDKSISVKLYENDYFIVNKDLIARNATSCDIDMIRDAQNETSALYDDLTAQINQTSSFLLDTIEGLSGEVDVISNYLSTDYVQKILDLSIALSGDIDHLSGELNETSSDLQRQIISNDKDIARIDNNISSISNDLYLEPNVIGMPGLSGKVEFLLSVGQTSMEYFGDAPQLDWTKQDRLALSDFLANFYKKENGDPDYDKFFKKGFTYRLSATQILTNRDKTLSVKLYENDYFIVNKDLIAREAMTSDINMIRDAQNETSALHDDLTSQIYQTSSFILDTVEGLSDEVNAISNYLSTDYVQKILDLSIALSGDIDHLSGELNETSSDLQRQIISNDTDISYLSSSIDYVSADLSTLEYDHYKKNISTDLSIYYDEDPHHNISAVVDQLLIVDEITFLRYRLTIRNGALNISLVDDIKPHK